MVKKSSRFVKFNGLARNFIFTLSTQSNHQPMHSNTKMKRIILNSVLFFLFNHVLAQNNPTHFKSELDFGNGTVISTFLDVSMLANNQFKITSPKNADLRIAGAKARLARLLGKMPKKGIMITIKGEQKADSLFGETKIPMIGKMKFKGKVNQNTLSGELIDTDGVSAGTILGVLSTEERIDQTALYPKMLKTIQDNIYSKDVLQTKAYKKFEKQIEKLCSKAHDDIELYFGFNMCAQKLPFSHLTLVITQESADKEEPAENEPVPNAPKSVVFEEKNSNTAYLQIKNFSSSTAELEAALPKIVANTAYKNLIIDLRENGGGGISAAFAFAKYIVTEDWEVGYFPTNKLQYSGYQPELFKTLSELQPKDTEEFGNELKKSPGVKLIFKKPTNPVFTGNLYVLTDGYTASTCEPIVYALKNHNKTTVIGERTYGGMLAASPFVVSGKYMLMIPIADFYTYDGVRLDRVGVAPDIAVKSDDALTKTLEIISQGN
jgi:C-terminal processing protease CtpA/Prc